jgi:hypothetical protein
MATTVSDSVSSYDDSNGVTYIVRLYFTYDLDYANQKVLVTNCYMSAQKQNASKPTPETGNGTWTWHSWAH